ncbi:MAG: nucleoside deaminase [Propionibacteriaceae bacterium]|jgi:tRNA(adenine34) deaminase|nr:nucleoside deaminase [Propionibacteriaceae bacterium]
MVVSRWDEAFDLALKAGREAWRRSGDVPVGAVVVDAEGYLLAVGGNERELTGDPTAHAEIVALRAAARQRGRWRLTGCSLIVTLEPCAMCAGAAVAARIDRLVYGVDDPKAGAVASLFDVVRDPRLPHQIAVTRGLRADDCAALLRDFFTHRRSPRSPGNPNSKPKWFENRPKPNHFDLEF